MAVDIFIDTSEKRSYNSNKDDHSKNYKYVCISERFHASKRMPPRNPPQPTSIPLIHRLPPELLADIFRHCLPTDRLPLLVPSEFPERATHVCRAWRRLALATPTLWATFEARVLPAAAHRAQLHLLAQHLGRSRRCPLRFAITHDPHAGHAARSASPNPYLEHTAELLAAVVPHAWRWRAVALVVPYAPVDRAVVACLGSPALREVVLRAQGIDLSVKDKVNAGNLAAMDIYSLGVRWAQLSELDLHLGCGYLPTLDQLRDILAESTSLVRCSISADCFLSCDSTPAEVVLPALKHLHLELRGDSVTPEITLASFLDGLSLPYLHSLKLECLVTGDEGLAAWAALHDPFAGLLAFLGRSAYTLETLDLSYLALSDGQISTALRALPWLTHVALRYALSARAHDPVTETLLVTLGKASLQSLSLQCSGRHCDEMALIALGEAQYVRAGEGAGGYFGFYSLKPITQAMRACVERWRGAGMVAEMDSLALW